MDIKEHLFNADSIPFCIHSARGELDSGYLHYHDCLEINYIDGKRYQMTSGDIFLINNYEHHFAGRQEHLNMKVLYFSPDFVWDHAPDTYGLIQAFYSKSRPNGNLFRLCPEQDLHFRRILDRLQQEYQEKRPGFQLFLKAGLMELLAILYRNCDSGLAYERLRPVFSYIQQHFHETLSLALLAEKACMSRTYFCSYFRNAIDMNVSTYIEQVRIRHAQLLLSTTSDSITDIGFSCGYRSLSSFHAAFRKLSGVTPNHFRQQHLTNTES